MHAFPRTNDRALIGTSKLHKIIYSAYFETLKLWNVRSGRGEAVCVFTSLFILLHPLGFLDRFYLGLAVTVTPAQDASLLRAHSGDQRTFSRRRTSWSIQKINPRPIKHEVFFLPFLSLFYFKGFTRLISRLFVCTSHCCWIKRIILISSVELNFFAWQ